VRISDSLKKDFDSTVSSFRKDFLYSLITGTLEVTDMPNLRG